MAHGAGSLPGPRTRPRAIAGRTPPRARKSCNPAPRAAYRPRISEPRMTTTYPEFEKSRADNEGTAEELGGMARKADDAVDVRKQAEAPDRKAADMLRGLYNSLDPWRKPQVAR